MKHLSYLAVLAAAAGLALPAAAQCPASGAAFGDGAEPIQLVLKYTWKDAETKPTALKTALEKLPTVVRTAFDEKARNQILVKFKGTCDQVSQLESAALAAGVPAYVINHAHVAIVLKAPKGADLKGAVEALGKVNGALYAKATANALDLHADLNKLDMVEIRLTAERFKCEATVDRSYEYVRFKVVEGARPDFETAAQNVKGVMVVRPEDDDVIGMWINKSVAKVEQIEKLEGFKVRRM